MNGKLDRTAIIGIAVCVILLIGYQPLMRMAGLGGYLQAPRPAARTAVAPNPATRMDAADSARAATGTATPRAEISRPGAPQEMERALVIETPLYRATFSNRGARLVSFEFTEYATAHGISSKGGRSPIDRRTKIVPPGDRATLAGAPLVGLDLGGVDAPHSLAGVVYAVRESADAQGLVRAITFTHQDSSGGHIRQTWRVRPGDYSLDYEVELGGFEASRLTEYSVTTRSWPLFSEADISSDLRALRASSLVGTNIHRDHAPGLVKNGKRFDGNALWAGVQSRYFLNAVAVVNGTSHGVAAAAERRDWTPEERASLPPGAPAFTEIAHNTLTLAMPGPTAPIQRFVVYVGPCEYFRLARLGHGLDRAVDLGWTWLLPFSKALLWLLNRIYDIVRNYGFAIILLATLVRLLLHPLNVSSMKSMRAMQRIQPELDRIRAKHKNDPQALNTAMMALYKEHKVNPAGGCLPLVLQMPMFIALYNVLFNAIELRRAPFIGWMHDLSAPDLLFMAGPVPIRLLPILMAGSGLLQQFVTPTNPEQKPTMYMMNVVMLVFFYNLPSGLVLYWTVMNLLTALQQWLVMRQDGGVVAPVQVVAAAPARKRVR